MYVCVRGGPNQPLHRDPQWSIVLPASHYGELLNMVVITMLYYNWTCFGLNDLLYIIHNQNYELWWSSVIPTELKFSTTEHFNQNVLTFSVSPIHITQPVHRMRLDLIALPVLDDITITKFSLYIFLQVPVTSSLSWTQTICWRFFLGDPYFLWHYVSHRQRTGKYHTSIQYHSINKLDTKRSVGGRNVTQCFHAVTLSKANAF
jgi:hypothetical protein